MTTILSLPVSATMMRPSGSEAIPRGPSKRPNSPPLYPNPPIWTASSDWPDPDWACARGSASQPPRADAAGHSSSEWAAEAPPGGQSSPFPSPYRVVPSASTSCHRRGEYPSGAAVWWGPAPPIPPYWDAAPAAYGRSSTKQHRTAMSQQPQPLGLRGADLLACTPPPPPVLMATLSRQIACLPIKIAPNCGLARSRADACGTSASPGRRPAVPAPHPGICPRSKSIRAGRRAPAARICKGSAMRCGWRRASPSPPRVGAARPARSGRRAGFLPPRQAACRHGAARPARSGRRAGVVRGGGARVRLELRGLRDRGAGRALWRAGPDCTRGPGDPAARRSGRPQPLFSRPGAARAW